MVSTANYMCCRGFFRYSGQTHLLVPNDGLFYGESETTFAAITDGLSNTIALGERTVLPAIGPTRKSGPPGVAPGA